MIDDMGIFRTTVSVAHPARPGDVRELSEMIVDTGSEYSWLPRAVLEELRVEPVRVDHFRTEDGRVLARAIGLVFLYAGGRATATVVAFAEEDDQTLLGAHGLEGLNLRVDLGSRELVPAGPLPAASLAA